MTFGIIILAITRVFIDIVIDEITLRQNVKEKKEILELNPEESQYLEEKLLSKGLQLHIR